MTTPDLRTAAEAAERLGVDGRTIRRWSQDGELKSVRTEPYLFEASEIERKAAELISELRAKLRHLVGDEVAA